jgi:hypothetical protein
MGKVSGSIGKVLGNVISYLFLVFHPRMLVKIACDYYEHIKMLQDSLQTMSESVKELGRTLHSR